MARTPEGGIGALTTRGDDLLNVLVNGQDCRGYETIDVDDTAPVGLTQPVPPLTRTAIIYIEADATVVNPGRVIRFREDVGGVPTAAEGMPLGNDAVYTIQDTANLTNFKMIGIEAGKTHKVRISYYG